MNDKTVTSSSSLGFLYCTNSFSPSLRIVGCTPPQPPCPFFGSSFSFPSASSLGSSASQTIFVLQNDHTTDILVFGSRTWRIRSAKLGSDYMSHNVIRETGKTSVIHCQDGHAEQRDKSRSRGLGTTKCKRNAFEGESLSTPAQSGHATGSRFRTPRSAPISPDHGSSESQSRPSLRTSSD